MRGRTNIPPRVGGIVNGIITECTVAENSGINVGDYVQLVKGTPIRSEDSKQVTNAWVYGPFELSDGSFVTFRYLNSVLYADITVMGVSGIVTESTSTISTSSMGNLTPSLNGSDSVSVVELSEDNFLLMMYDGTSGAFARVERVDLGWSLTKLSHSWSYTGSVVGAIICRISSTKFVLGFNGGNLAVGTISSSSLSISDVMTLSPQSSNSLKFIEVVNGYILTNWSDDYNGYLISLSLEGSTLTQISTGTAMPVKQTGISKVAEDKLLMLYQDSTLFYASQSGYVKSYLITVDINGYISVVTNREAIHFNISGSTYYRFSEVTSQVLEDGRILVIAIRSLRSGSSGSYTFNGDVYYSIGAYDSSDETTNFTELEKLDSQYLLLSYSTTGSRLLYVKPIETTDGLIWFSAGLNDYTSSNSYRYVKYDFITRVEQDTLIDVSETPLVKKYSNRINGVAKTSGVYGSTIEVYAPSTLL